MDLPIFVLSIKRCTKRRASITKELGKFGLDFEFVDAFEGRDLTPQQLSLNRYYRPGLVVPSVESQQFTSTVSPKHQQSREEFLERLLPQVSSNHLH